MTSLLVSIVVSAPDSGEILQTAVQQAQCRAQVFNQPEGVSLYRQFWERAAPARLRSVSGANRHLSPISGPELRSLVRSTWPGVTVVAVQGEITDGDPFEAENLTLVSTGRLPCSMMRIKTLQAHLAASTAWASSN
jgi:hypothetical protein